MSSSPIVLLGAIAGFTIFLGLPLRRMRAPLPRLNAAARAAKFGELAARAILLGIVPGFVTDAIVTAAGA